jgi:hypothetical protein
MVQSLFACPPAVQRVVVGLVGVGKPNGDD